MPRPRDWIRTPQQGRSQATSARILAAAEELAGSQELAELSVADIARHAGVSVGGFYARFKSKEALLHAFDEAFVERMLAAMHAALHGDRLRGASLADVVAAYVTIMVESFARERQVVRQIVQHARVASDDGFRQRLAAFNKEAHGLLEERLLERREQIGHDDPLHAIRFGIGMVSASAQYELLVRRPKRRLTRALRRELTRDLVRAYLAFLGAADALTWEPTSP